MQQHSAHMQSQYKAAAPVLMRADLGERQKEVAQHHSKVLMVHAVHMLHEAWAPQPLGLPTGIEGPNTGGHQSQALIHGLPHLPGPCLSLKAQPA